MGILDLKIDLERGSYRKSKSHTEPTSSNSNLDNSISITSNFERSSCPSSFTEDNRIPNYVDIELYRAASKNDVNGFTDVLQKVSREKELSLHAIFESVSPLNNTLLHVAASCGNEEIVKLIANHSPSILTRRNSKGDTPLHVAAKAGHGSALSTLICLRRDYIDSSSSSDHGVTVREIDWDNLLLRVRNEEENTALHEALIHGHIGVAEALIEADPEVSFYLNKEGKSPLYLAAQAGYKTCVVSMLVLDEYVNPDVRLLGKSPIHAAIASAATTRRKTDILDFMLEEEPRFIHLRDEEGRTALHCASSIGYLDGVRYLLGKSISTAVQRDDHGLFPIHMASTKGHVDVIEELLQYCPYPAEMLCYNDQNILHVAAKSGKLNVVNYILKNPELEKLINQRDKDGNTPLHLATMQWHPKIVSALTWDKKVDLKLINNEGLTAFDAAECYMERKASFRKRLTWRALRSAGAPRAPCGKVVNTDRQTYIRSEASSMDYYKDRVNTLLLVSTLVATVTFAAGFTMPGGYSNANPHQGTATMLRHSKFYVFVFCDTIAMYSSIMVAVLLTWAQLGDIHLVFIALRAALPLLGIALTMMSLAFTAGIFLVVSELSWLANSVLIIGIVFLVALSALFFPLCFSISSSIGIFRYISYYPFCLLMLVTGSYTTPNSEE